MQQYGVLYCQEGGCDYTIGCGYRFELLPKEIDTFKKAEDWVIADEWELLERTNDITIFGINSYDKYTSRQLLAPKQAILREAAENEAKELRRKQFLQLKKEFE